MDEYLKRRSKDRVGSFEDFIYSSTMYFLLKSTTGTVFLGHGQLANRQELFTSCCNCIIYTSAFDGMD